jgi:phosphoglycerate dehydrogenase-like enzyme
MIESKLPQNNRCTEVLRYFRILFMQIVLCYPVTERHLSLLQAAAPHATFINAGQEQIAKRLIDADIFIGHAKVPVDWDPVVRQGRLQWIQSSAAGLDHCLTPSVIESPILVSSASGLFAKQVAEQTMALLFGLLRSLPTFFRAMHARDFTRRPTDDLRGKTVGIVGLGGNGRCIARVLRPFDVRLIATDYFPDRKTTEVDELLPAEALDQLLERSDIVILTMPLNASTLGVIDRHRFAKMRPGSYFVNVARGQVVVEADLVAAIQSGQLAGVGLDVTEVEPLPASSPLWSMPNVIITPHVGAQSATRIDDTTALACDNLQRYLAGQEVWNRVDKRLGFPHPEVLWPGAL